MDFQWWWHWRVCLLAIWKRKDVAPGYLEEEDLAPGYLEEEDLALGFLEKVGVPLDYLEKVGLDTRLPEGGRLGT